MSRTQCVTYRLRPPASGLQPPACCLPARRGISLMEVLISMGILFVGLLCVAALIPAGRFEILQGAKVDHATMVGRAAFRDLKIRGYLNPANWRDSSGTALYKLPDASHATNWFSGANAKNPGTDVTPAVAIDPLGLTAATSYGPTFPYFPTPPATPFLSRIFPDAQVPALATQAERLALVDLVFRNSDDLLFVANTAGRDLPPTQQMFAANGKRGSEGNYSWLATIVTDPTSSAVASKVTVSVAVFYKRDLSAPATTERAVGATIVGGGLGGGEVVLTFPAPGAKPLKPGAWIMLAGRVPAGAGVNYDYFRWYRAVAADVVTGTTQNVTLAGADWNPATPTTAWLFDGVIAVYEKNMRLEME